MQGGEEARSETYLSVRCNDKRRSQRRRWAFFNRLRGSPSAPSPFGGAVTLC